MKKDKSLHQSKKAKKEAITAYLFVLPYVLLFLVFIVLPIIVAIALSFTKYDMISSPTFNGFSNYVYLLTSDDELILRGNLSSKLFSKLVNDSSYIPSKNVVFSFGIAMKLNEDELSSLLNSCGYALNKTNLLDLIVCFYIDSNLYDVYKINNALFNYNILPLGEKD